MTGEAMYAEVVLPLALAKNYTYAIPEEWQGKAVPGVRVVVQFGKRKMYTALIWRISQTPPAAYVPKPIEAVLDDEPIITPTQQLFWEWMADYYLCHTGDVMNAALPAGFKLESETRISLHPTFAHDYSMLSDEEYLIAEALSVQEELTLKQVQELLGKKTVYPIIKRMLQMGVLFQQEELQDGYKPKTEIWLDLGPDYQDEEARRTLFQELNRAPKQLEALLAWFHLHTLGKSVRKSELLAAVGKNYTVVAKMIEKGIFSAREEEVSRLPQGQENVGSRFDLSPAQQTAFDNIRLQWQEHSTVLLRGVTSSGKTEIYIKLIEETLQQGGQVLYLLPEIALTAQMIQRLKRVFGDTIGIYHSRFSSNERIEVWQKTLRGEYRILLGARSALMLPFRDLQLVIVDEEHDRSYKQFDPAPRYNARDAAIWLATKTGARVLLGSATPSIESYYNATKGKYGLVNLLQRYGDIQLPEMKLVDVTKSTRISHNSQHLSEELVAGLKQVLDAGEQAILFRNRRGYAPMLVCGTCGYIPNCPNCDVSLTYHKYNDRLKCHYCGHHQPTVTACPACGAHHMRVTGFGTEKIEDELHLLFPKAQVARLDLDATKGKQGHQDIIHDFETGKTDILVGTQMVTKGLDFEKVALVGILSADQLIHYPDFRSHERAFQLMVQVAGRSGRKGRQGKVLIQIRQTNHPLLPFVLNHDFPGFFQQEMAERQQFTYPPMIRMLNLHFRHQDRDRVFGAARLVHRILAKGGVHKVYDPTAPTVGRVRNQYLADIMVKVPRTHAAMQQVRQLLHEAEQQLSVSNEYKRVTWYIDADPY